MNSVSSPWRLPVILDEAKTRTLKDHLNNVDKFTSLGKYRNKKDRDFSQPEKTCARHGFSPLRKYCLSRKRNLAKY